MRGAARRSKRALHTCTSWYAYAAIFGSSNQQYAINRSHTGSLSKPNFVSHNLWRTFNYYVHLVFRSLQALAQWLALSWPDLSVTVYVV